MWYTLAAKGMVTLYHGTSRENYLLMRASGVLKNSDTPNFTISKSVAKAWATSFFGIDEPLFVLTFVVPVEMVDWKPGANVAVGNGDIPMKYCTKAEPFKPNKVEDPSEIQHGINVKNTVQDLSSPANEKQMQEKLKELSRNPSAYLPAWMRKDPRFKGYAR